MSYGLYISAEGAQAQSTRLEVLSNNLANVDTIGFKRDITGFQARFAEAIDRGLAFAGDKSLNDQGGGIFVKHTRTDFSTGPLEPTNSSTDVAIKGEGFFMINKRGENLLTRAGNFVINPLGALMTAPGDPVLDGSGSPIAVDPEAGPIEITTTGDILQAGAVVGQLAVVMPQSLDELQKTGENAYRTAAGTTPVPLEERNLISGFLEKSTVRPAEEMMELIEASRAYEANVNLIKHQDQMLSTLIGRVLKV